MKRLDDKGMTLVELIVAMMISTIIGAAIISIILVTMNLYTEQQVRNRQYIIIDYIEQTIGEELRYAESVSISDAAVGSVYDSTYSYIETISGEIVKTSGTDVKDLCGESILYDHTVRVDFQCNPNTADASSVLYVEVYVDEGTEQEVMEAFYVKVLNLEYSGTGIQIDTGASGNKIYYKVKSL